MKALRTILLFVVLMSFPAVKLFCQFSHVDPPFWWTGMHNKELIITFHGKDIAGLDPFINYQGVTIQTVTKTKNPNYLFLELTISPEANPGNLLIKFNKGKKTVAQYTYELRQRKNGSSERESFTSKDVIYLLMPDRFSNGNPANDSSQLMPEKPDRNNPDGRHGGDIQGIISKMDYLQDLGITALWTTPVLEDNLPVFSYHTYAITDYYKIDPRYGTNDDYVSLSNECHKRGIKMIMDMVPNHCGSGHWWMKDMPMPDWIHQFPEFTRTNYTIATWNDPHASASDLQLYEDGWFDVTMPDLNQDNRLLLTYFKQFAIFWVEYADLDGLRVDTYPYNDKWKIAEWTKAIRDEYPNLNIMGECTQHRPSEIAYWQSGVSNFDQYDSGLPTVMDFPLKDAFLSAFNDDGNGVSLFYNLYVMDYLYANTDNILVFLDNHDTQRFSEQIAFDLKKYKMGIAHLLTTRGIPQIYSGTEIMMGGSKSKGDGDIRHDFPGGWPGDKRNAFTAEGRTSQENEAFNYMRTLLHYRKTNPVLHTGRMVHFIPRDNVYVYFRINMDKTVMVIINNSTNTVSPDMHRFEECLKGKRIGTDIITGNRISLEGMKMEGKTALIIEM